MQKNEQLIGVDVLSAAFAAALQSVKPEKEIKEGDPEYKARQQAEGWFDTFLDADGKPITVYQNAYEADARGLSLEVRQRAGTLKPGRYTIGRGQKRDVTVEVNGQGVTLKYAVSGDNMLRNTMAFTDFSDLINQLWDRMHEPVTA